MNELEGIMLNEKSYEGKYSMISPYVELKRPKSEKQRVEYLVRTEGDMGRC